MSQFYYDCIDKFIDRSDYQLIEMDTDSSYMALTDDFEALIKPEMKNEFEKEKHLWFPRTDTDENIKFDKRKAGLFKIEFKGKGIVALAPKMYYVKGFSDKDKVSCKGIQQRNNSNLISFENYKRVVLRDVVKMNATNKGLRIFSNQQINRVDEEKNQNKKIFMYSQEKVGLTAKYDKRRCLEDGVSTVPLDI